MKLKLKDLKLIASMLPLFILLCAIEMGGCDSDNDEKVTSCNEAKQQLKDADDALDKAKQDVREAESAV